MTRPSSHSSVRILVLGGGFGGVYAALRLQERLGGQSNVRMTLVSRENFFLFTPMLHEIAAGDLDPADIVSPIRSLLHSVDFINADVERIDLNARKVAIAHGFERHSHDLEYDYLVLAMGSITNFFMLPGVEKHAITMKSLGDAVQLRNRIVAHLEEADAEAAIDPDEARALLTFVVAGGGFAGIETIAGVNDFVRESLRFYPHLTEDMVRMVVAHPGNVVLPELGPDLGAYAQRKLTARKIEILTQTKVVEATDEGVRLSDGTFVPSRTLIWTAGTAPHPLIGSLPCDCERGRVVVDEFLQVPKWPRVFALGDCACVPDAHTGKPHPPTAQHAVRQAKIASDNVVADMRGWAKEPFDFRLIGQLAAIGRRTGVAKVFGVKFSGFIAWWLWRTIYLSKLPRLEKKVRVAIDWTLDLMFSKDLTQYMSSTAPAVSHDMHDEEHGHAPSRSPESSPRGAGGKTGLEAASSTTRDTAASNMATVSASMKSRLARSFDSHLPLARKAYNLLILAGTSIRSPLLLLIRLYWGYQFFLTGKAHLTHLQDTTDFFTSLHLPLPRLQAIMAGSTECFGGLLLLLGLGSRLISIPLAFTMIIAFLTADVDKVKNIFNDTDAFVTATPFLFLLASVIIFIFGPGAFSADRLIGRYLSVKPADALPTAA